MKKKNSKLSIIAFVLCLTAVLGIIGAVLAIIDLAKKDKDQSHAFSIIGLGILGAYILGAAFSDGSGSASVSNSSSVSSSLVSSMSPDSASYDVSNDSVSTLSASVSASSVPVSIASSSDASSSSEPYITNSESLKKLFKNTFDFKYDDLSVDYHSDSKLCDVAFTSRDDVWDSSDFVNKCISEYVAYSSSVYSSSDVSEVYFKISTSMQDSKGNVSDEIVFNIGMDSSEFATYNWKNLEFSPIYDQLNSSCDSFYIDPSIWAGVKKDSDIFYVPYKK